MQDYPAEFSGPKMSALADDRRRRFAWFMACGELSGAEAARRAGFSDHLEAAKVRAHHLMHDPNVLDAIEEASRNVLRGLGPLAIVRARGVLNNPDHPSHARMIETVLDRTGFFAKTEHKVVVEHVDNNRMAEIAARIALELGVDRMKLVGSNVVEGEVEYGTVVSRETDERAGTTDDGAGEVQD